MLLADWLISTSPDTCPPVSLVKDDTESVYTADPDYRPLSPEIVAQEDPVHHWGEGGHIDGVGDHC